MSRGPGKVQRAILGYLETDPDGASPVGPMDVSLFRVTCAVFGTDEPTESQRASVRRAAWQLYRAGLIVMTERTAEGTWTPDDPNARFYRRQRRSAARLQLDKVAVSEKYISRLATPGEAERARTSIERPGRAGR